MKKENNNKKKDPGFDMDSVLIWITSLYIKKAKKKKNNDKWELGKKLKILFVGYTGARNTGADVRVAAMVDQFHHVLGKNNIETSVMALDYDLVKIYFENNSNIIHYNSVFFKDLLNAVSKNHMVVLCEGSCFKSKFANALSVLMAGSAGMMDIQGKKAIAYGSEVGDMDKKLENFIQKYCQNAFIISRSAPSHRLVQEMGMKGDLGTDTAWTFEPGPEDWAVNKLKEAGWDGKKPIMGLAVINPFIWPVKPNLMRFLLKNKKLKEMEDHYDKWYFFTYDDERKKQFNYYISSIADAANEFMKEHDVFPVVIGMERLDFNANKELQKKLNFKNGKAPIFCSIDYDGYQMVSILHKLNILLSSRYHAIVLSMIAGVPSGGVTMDERITNIMEERGHLDNLCVWVDENNLKNKILNILNELWDNGDEISEAIYKKIPEYLKKMSYMGKIMKDFVRINFPNIKLPLDPKPDNWRGYLPKLHLKLEDICKKYDS